MSTPISFDDALRGVAAQLGLHGPDLIRYAFEDQVRGSEGVDGRLIPYTADGKFLYALVRALRPTLVLESGTNEGGSAVHIAMALRANGKGHLTTVDIRHDSGQHIPYGLRPFVTVVHADICEFMQRPALGPYDFIHEDASHMPDTVHAVYAQLHRIAAPGGVIVSHDTATYVGDYVRSGMRAAGYVDVPEYTFHGSPCGFSVLRV